MIGVEDSSHVALPPERFYFAAVEVPARGRVRHQQILYSIEPMLPVSLEDVHASVVKTINGTIVVCAAPRTMLDELPATTITLRPSVVPEFLAGVVEPEQFNLLTGPYEPRLVRRWRKASNAVALIAIVLLIGSVMFGFARRTSELRNATHAHDAAVQSVAHRVIADESSEAHSTQQLFLQLTAELRSLRQTRSTDIVDPELFDASETLVELLSRWPNDLVVHTDLLNITRSQITIRADVPTSNDVQRLADALAQMPGWELRQPRVNATSGGASCTITLVQKESTP